jgi:translation initiation factor 1
MVSMNKTHAEDAGFVYSTDHGKMCPQCSQPISSCACQRQSQVVGSGHVVVGRSTKGRKGAGATTISGLPLTEAELKQLAKQLKQRCGSGGAVKDGVIEIQGEHRDLLIAELQKRGYQPKRSGG